MKAAISAEPKDKRKEKKNLTAGDKLPKLGKRQLTGIQEHGGQRDQDKQPQIGKAKAQSQTKTGNYR
ncbi:hypothetical protein OS42_33970 [Dickeya oryzae]